MVMIPIDVGIQVRNQQVEPGLSPVRAVSGLPTDLPDFQRGQTFSARIQEVLPNNTYKALVAGRSVTLSLLESAKAGDTLDLVAVDRTPGAVVAKLAARLPGTVAESVLPTTLSRTGQLIGSLLSRDGEPAAPTALTRGQSLLPQAPTNAAGLANSLAPKLAQAVGTSGLFYEAHQLQWVHGQRQLASLLVEPQGEHSRAETLAAWRGVGIVEELATKSALAGRRDSPVSTPSPVSLLQTLFGREPVTEAAAAPKGGGHSTILPSIPEELRSLVQQQLEAVATQRLAWHGEIWPGQDMTWEIERESPKSESEPNDEVVWHTSLRLNMPRLGEIDARIQMTKLGVKLVLQTSSASSASDLRNAAPELQQALAVAGLTLIELKANNEAG